MNITEKIIRYVILPVLIVLAITGIIDAYFFEYVIDKNGPINLVLWLSGCGALIGLCLFVRPAKHTHTQPQQTKKLTKQELQVEQQNKQVDVRLKAIDRFQASVELLASNNISSRIAGIHSFYQLAIDPKGAEYCVRIAQILCSYIRSETQEQKYQQRYKNRPSLEVQTAINILFRNIEDVKGIYLQNFGKKKNFPRADLSRTYLHKANFKGAHCQGVDFTESHCQKAVFVKARCQEASFRDAECQEANFGEAQCQRAYFINADLKGANFATSQIQETNFRRAQCQGACFISAQLHGACFNRTHCQGVYFRKAQLQRVDFTLSKLQGANFSRAYCQGADFREAQCQGVDFTLAKIQGGRFHDTQFQGAYTAEDSLLTPAMGFITAGDQLRARIKKSTNLKTLKFRGPLGQYAIEIIKKIQYLPTEWYEAMEKIREEHENKKVSYAIPKGVVGGVLEDSHELQDIIKELDAIEQQKQGNA